MAGTSSKTEVITLRVAVAVAAEWRATAASGGVTIGSFIIGRADAVPVLHRQIEGLNETGDAMRKAIEAKDARIAELETALTASLDARQSYLDEIAELKGRLASHRNTALAAVRSDPAVKAIDPRVHHVSGPVLTDPVPRDVAGKVEWCGLKGQDKAKGKAKP